MKFEPNDEQKRFFSGIDEVELTDELIEAIVKQKKWRDENSLREMKKMGGKWNTERNSVVFPAEEL